MNLFLNNSPVSDSLRKTISCTIIIIVKPTFCRNLNQYIFGIKWAFHYDYARTATGMDRTLPTLIFENLKAIEVSKNNFNIISISLKVV